MQHCICSLILAILSHVCNLKPAPKKGCHQTNYIAYLGLLKQLGI